MNENVQARSRRAADSDNKGGQGEVMYRGIRISNPHGRQTIIWHSTAHDELFARHNKIAGII
jgi:hypothetical protein